jgi:hypothetical protein
MTKIKPPLAARKGKGATTMTRKEMFDALQVIKINLRRDLRREQHSAEPNQAEIEALEFEIAALEMAIARLKSVDTLTETLATLTGQFSTEEVQ